MQTILKICIAALLLTACNGARQETPEQSTDKDSSETTHAGITLTGAQLQAVGITLGPVSRKNLTEVVKANGQLAVPPQNKADIHALSGGMITRINVLEGQSVQRGQVLLSVENPDFIKLQQDYLSANSNFTYVQAEYNRQMALKAADAGTGKFYQQAEASYNAERARLTGLANQLRQLGISPAAVAGGHFVQQVPITAPISGTVGHIAVNTGTYAGTGMSLLEIIDNTNIHCDLVVFEKDLFKVQNGQEVTFSLTNQNNQEIRGKIYGINKSFEDESKGIIVHAVIEGANKYHLIPGMYVTALINTGKTLSDAVPVDAVVQSEGKHFVFALQDQRNDVYTFAMREVVTGVTEQGYVQIKPLDTLGVRIVQQGAFYLLSKVKGGGEEE